MLLFKIKFWGKKDKESRIPRDQIQGDMTYQDKELGFFSKDLTGRNVKVLIEA